MEKAIVFGTGKYYREKEAALCEEYEIAYYLDNGAGERKSLQGRELLSPASAGERLQSGTEPVLLTSLSFWAQYRQLRELGVSEERILLPYRLQPAFSYEEVLLRAGVRSMVFQEGRLCISFENGRCDRLSAEEEWKPWLRTVYRECFPLIDAVRSMPAEPISLRYGTERGTAVDRRYIEQVMKENREWIRGDVLEIEEPLYTEKYGQNVSHSLVMHVDLENETVFRGNLETGEGIREEIADCFICTQTLMYIGDLKSAVRNVHKLLRKGGVAIITCSGISQISKRCADAWGSDFFFDKEGLRYILSSMFSEEQILRLGSYGNAKTVISQLAGLCAEDLEASDFIPADPCYPLVVYAVVRK